MKIFEKLSSKFKGFSNKNTGEAQQYTAFTLAEVLIVLGIIGIVAEMTIPTLMSEFQGQVASVSLKKAYSTISQAYTMTSTDNGTPETWGLTAGASGSVIFAKKFTPYLKIVKDCGTGPGCFPDLIYKHYDNKTDWGNMNQATDFAKFQLADGSLWSAYSYDPACNSGGGSTPALSSICGYFYIDINGAKPPNQVGKDFFLIYLTKYGMIPVGTQDEPWYTFENHCLGSTPSGWGCTAWIIYNGNMDYMKCSDLSWTGKHKCG